MNSQRAFRTGAIAVICAALSVTACSESFEPPSSGQLTVDVSAAAGPGAAFKVMVIGEGISQPVAANAGDLLYSFASNDTVKVAVIGERSSGPLFRFSVPDGSFASSYTVVLLEVAGSDNALLAGADFTLTARN
ncbi:MAG: hypothetical protein JSW46_20255 [Gemmatimonadota bacterium]|nr:MAG: hypothetical protein JSW46_20255 [Gemmatimonadota bacterium]